MTKKVKRFPRLEACRFCGGKVKWKVVPGTERDTKPRYRITCTQCGATLSPSVKEPWVVGWWNNRATKRYPAISGCPLCGGNAILVSPCRLDPKWYIRCLTSDVCGVKVGPFDTAEEAADFWNRAGDVEEDEKQ